MHILSFFFFWDIFCALGCSIFYCNCNNGNFLGVFGNPDAKRLYDDLLSNYNKLVRPVVNVSDAVTVRLKLKLSQLIDVVSVLFFIIKQLFFRTYETK